MLEELTGFYGYGETVARKARTKAEFGDFQTPVALAEAVCGVAQRLAPRPTTIIEPTCGVGSFLVAARRAFGNRPKIVGVEINASHLKRASEALGESSANELLHADFFNFDWQTLLHCNAPPFLVVGNPPWVTNADLGTLASSNLPRKSNFQGLTGLDAITGKSNFDISEWMCIHLLELLSGKKATFALLVKTAVARKVLVHAWKQDLFLSTPAIFTIDAKSHFGAAVDACLFVGRTHEAGEQQCAVYSALDGRERIAMIGYEDGKLVADIDARRDTVDLTALSSERPDWRSGIKHDCAGVLELRPCSGALVNGLGEEVEVEDEFLFPLQKSSDVAAKRGDGGKRLIVTQRVVGQATAPLETLAPRLWSYLVKHGERLDARKSSIYRGKPRFSMFGVGDYTFAPWKIAISGLYKKIDFVLQGPVDGKPVVFDDTVYFLAYETEEEARRAHDLLCSDIALRFCKALIFWDAKRPVTAGILRQLSLERLAARLELPEPSAESAQIRLFA